MQFFAAAACETRASFTVSGTFVVDAAEDQPERSGRFSAVVSADGGIQDLLAIPGNS